MRIHTSALLSVSNHCAQVASPPKLVLSLFGKNDEALECLRLKDAYESQVTEQQELMRAVAGGEFLGICLIGFGLDLKLASVAIEGMLRRSRYLLLAELTDSEAAGYKAYRRENEDWVPADLVLTSDDATGIAVSDALASGASDTRRAKLVLRDKLKDLQKRLDSGDDAEVASVIAQYGQLKKLSLFRAVHVSPEGSSTARAHANYELIARVIEKSDARHRRCVASNSGHLMYL